MKQQRKVSWKILKSSTLLLAMALGATACQGNHKGGAPTSASQAESSAAGEEASGFAPALEGRKIVYTGQLSLLVKSYDKARAEVDRLVAASGGFVASGETQGSGEHRYSTLTLRIPSSEFATLSHQLKILGKVDHESIAADDVTEQHVDLSARLANARQFEARLLELVAQKADSVADLLVVEAELARVREQIERLDAQVRNLDSQVSMATLTLSIYSEGESVAALSLSERMSAALTTSYRALGESGAALMIAFSALLPWALLFALIALAIRRFRWTRTKPAVASAGQS